MSSAASLRAVRSCFGLSQPMLAPWLGLSRSLLALVETDREQLPAHARPWLRPWVAALALAETTATALPEPAPEAAAVPSAGPALVLARLAECHYQARRLGQQYAALQAAHGVAARRLVAGPLLLAFLASASATTLEAAALARRRRWLVRLLEEATDALDPAAPAGPVAAVLLDARRSAWLREAACLRAYLAGAALPDVA
ncbi:hypothetical protein [Hymenobacter rubripertinctus]|uniref:hypothetical protein n=1 Tax=Hymenobacter rubripertinctus TaxID=2029981 RepID=UPI0016010A32|nr:hypothetical protein [Hymenobacter rubripertinctus]